MSTGSFDGDKLGIAMCDALLAKLNLSKRLRSIVLEIRSAYEIPDDEYHDFIPRLHQYSVEEWDRQQVNYSIAAEMTWGEFTPENYPEFLERFEKYMRPLNGADDVESQVVAFPNPIHGPFPEIAPRRRVYFRFKSDSGSTRMRILLNAMSAINFSRRSYSSNDQFSRLWDSLHIPEPPGGVKFFFEKMNPNHRDWRLLWVEDRSENEMALAFNEEPREGFDLLRWLLLASGSQDVWRA